MDVESRQQMGDIDRQLESLLGEDQFSSLLKEPPTLSYESVSLPIAQFVSIPEPLLSYIYLTVDQAISVLSCK